jgi:hypothetical protein
MSLPQTAFGVLSAIYGSSASANVGLFGSVGSIF